MKTKTLISPKSGKQTKSLSGKVRTLIPAVVLGALSGLTTTIPVTAAEKIQFIFGPLSLSIRIESLEAFAQDGTINQNLAFYLRGTTSEQQEKFREALTKKVEVDPVVLSRFFNTAIGEDILTRFGNLVTIQGGRNGKYALRAALIQAAFEPEGLSLINFFRKLPTNMRIDLAQAMDLARAIDVVVLATMEFTQKIAKLSAQEAESGPKINFAQLPDLTQPGPYGVKEKRRWILNDTSRRRRFYVDIHQPQKWRADQTPVVIFSHGLASRPEDFARRAQHLASYGYLVVLPQHPGSDYNQAMAFLNGQSREIFDVKDFINRPKDISYVIDELERRNNSEFDGQLKLNSVGVMGHSFGAYGALAVAGATIDFENLQRECNRRFAGLNTSLFLQCRALDLPRENYNFEDKRVIAVGVNNPVNSAIFGRQSLSKIKVPIIIGAGTHDPATPAIFEQVRVFPWLTVPNKYLGLMEGQAHVDFSQLDAGLTDMINSVPDFTLPSPDLIDTYYNGVVVAFWGKYLAQDEKYQPYLSGAYSAFLSQGQEFKMYLITNQSSEQLSQMLQDFRLRHQVDD